MSNHALTLLAASAKFAPTSANLVSAGKILSAQLTLIREADPMIAKRAIFVGTALLLIKESLAHGQFGPWLEKNIDDLGRRQVTYYMKLALAALNKTSIDQKALAAVPVGDIESALVANKGPAVAFRVAVEEFVGDSSLADLLAEYCGKNKGASKKAKASGDKDAGEDVAAETVQDRCNELIGELHVIRSAVEDKALWMSMSRAQHDEVRAAAEATAEHVRQIYIKTHGKNAAKK